MQINVSSLQAFYPAPLEQAREPVFQPPPVIEPSPDLAEPIERPVDEVERVQELFERREPLDEPVFSVSEDARTRMALAEYDAVQHYQERVYVSTVLGIDAYA